MSSTTWISTSDTNYLNSADWSNGAPATGSTVNVPESTAVPTATNVAIANEQISLTGTGAFNASGTTSFDAATTIQGTPMNGNRLFLNDSTVNNGTITDATLIIGGSLSTSATVTNANTGVITYNVAVSSNGGNYIDGSSVASEGFANNGTFNVISQPGATNTIPPSGVVPPIPTTVEWGSSFSGTGQVNIVGGSPNSTTAIPFISSAPQQAYMQFDGGAPVSGSLTFNLNDGYVTFASIATASFNFQDASGVVRFASGTDIGTGNTITGFRAGDVLGIGTAVSSAGLSYNNATDVLSYTDTSGRAHAFTIMPTGGQVYTTASFVVDNNGTNGYSEAAITTTAAAPCYCPGTMIEAANGEVAVEDLSIGDHVITANGPEPIIWIGRRSFDGRFIEGRHDVLPVCIRAGALGDGVPRRDLWVSPLHAMFLGGMLVPAHALINGVSITQAASVDQVTYIHIELARHDVIWAEGALSETFVDDRSRSMFHNAAEFERLYPGRPRIEAVYCAPRISSGEALEIVRQSIDQRAGCHVATDEPIEGCLDGVAGSVVWGWARNPAKPAAPVCVELLVDGVVVSRAVACRFRPDLAQAEFDSGRYGFEFELPGDIVSGDVRVRRVADGAELPREWKAAA